MIKKLMSIGVVLLVLALLLTLVPCCGKEKGEVRTLNIGIITPLSGFGATWGTQAVIGAEWVRDRVNEQGGIKVGNDRYLIEFVECDSKEVGSECATCAMRLIYDEGCKFLALGVSDISSVAVAPIAEENEVIWLGAGSKAVSPQHTYTFTTFYYTPQAATASYTSVHEVHPEIKTVGLLMGLPMPEMRDAILDVAPKVGIEVVKITDAEPGSADFYPALTPLIAKNPDAINIEAYAGAQPLMVKQARELGYTGHIFSVAGCPPEPMLAIAGPEYAEGYGGNFGEFTSPLYPPETNALYYEFYERYPDKVLDNTVYWAYGTIMALVTGIEAAQSVDPTAVRDAMGAPDFTWDYMGMPNTFGGEQTLGIRRQATQWIGYSEIRNGELVMLYMVPAEPIP